MYRMPQRGWTRLALAFSCSLPLLCQAKPLSAAEQAFVGEYTQSSVDTLAQLLLTDDHTFCYSFMGGARDRLLAGHWQAVPGQASRIRLTEQRASQPLFPVLLSATPGEAGKVQFDFHGYSLSEANRPGFAIGTDENLPGALRPLFVEDKSSWSESYPTPALAKAQARYFYLGQLELTPSGQPGLLKVSQYPLKPGQQLRVGFDAAQAEPLLDAEAELKRDTLYIQGGRFGHRQPAEAELVAQAREYCIQPILANKPAPDSEPDSGTAGQMLKPLRQFTLPASALQGAVWFPEQAE
ncbi:hypothetical protein [Chitinimonas taiwanensis]|uniref:hypothetical protein n=1 Tax=Chitinimonas taiwanensis TaxID=240412 RepID=UPI0035AEB3ED